MFRASQPLMSLSALLAVLAISLTPACTTEGDESGSSGTSDQSGDGDGDGDGDGGDAEGDAEGGAEEGGAETGGVETGGAETGGAETGGAETGGTETGGTDGDGGTYGLTVSTYFGGLDADTVRDVAWDSAGNFYITGGTSSDDFPITVGAYDTTYNGGTSDVFVVKFDPSGSVVWSTLMGGPNHDRSYAIEVDSAGYVYLGGRAGPGFPVTQGAFQFYWDGEDEGIYGLQDFFVAKLLPDGSDVVWSSYFGGGIRDIDVDTFGNVYVGGGVTTRPFPHITMGAFQSSPQGGEDGVIAKVSADGSAVLWATYLGGTGDDGAGPSVRKASCRLLTARMNRSFPSTATFLSPPIFAKLGTGVMMTKPCSPVTMKSATTSSG